MNELTPIKPAISLDRFHNRLPEFQAALTALEPLQVRADALLKSAETVELNADNAPAAVTLCKQVQLQIAKIEAQAKEMPAPLDPIEDERAAIDRALKGLKDAKDRLKEALHNHLTAEGIDSLPDDYGNKAYQRLGGTQIVSFDLAKLPPEYLTIDEKKVKAALKDGAVAGVRTNTPTITVVA